MDYCSAVWGHVNTDEPNKIENRAIRVFLGVHDKAPKLGMRGDMGWLDPQIRHRIAGFRLWNRLVLMDDSRLTKMVFNWDRELYRQGSNNWTRDMYRNFEMIESTNIFETLAECNLVDATVKLEQNANSFN